MNGRNLSLHTLCFSQSRYFCADITVFNVQSSAFYFLSYYYKQILFRIPIAMEMMLRAKNIHVCFVLLT